MKILILLTYKNIWIFNGLLENGITTIISRVIINVLNILLIFGYVSQTYISTTIYLNTANLIFLHKTGYIPTNITLKI
jgi:hypothetical protein